MSTVRDNYRANQPPSKVLHVRHLPPDATEADVIAFCRPFGRVTRIKMVGGGPGSQGGGGHHGAFVEFETLRGSIAVITYFAGSTDPPRVNNKNVLLQYSTRPDIGPGATVVAAAAPTDGPVLLVVFGCANMDAGPSVEAIGSLFGAHGGRVAKVALQEPPAGGLQALVQFADAAAAPRARAALDGAYVPPSALPDGGAGQPPVAMRVTHSPVSDIVVRLQSERMRDFTNPDLPFESVRPKQQRQKAQEEDEGAGECRVLLAMVEDLQYPPSVEALSQVFSVYGPLAKMSLSCHAGGSLWRALVQYRDAAAAAAAKRYLHGHAMYPGGANKLMLEFSMQQDLHVPQDDEWGWDWTRGEAEAASAAAAAPSAATAVAAATAAAATAGASTEAAAPVAATKQQEEPEDRPGGAPTGAGGAGGGGASGASFVAAYEEVARIAAAAAAARGGDLR